MISDVYSHGQVTWDLTIQNHKKKNSNRLVRRQVRGLNIDRHTIQEAHDTTWIGVRGLNTGTGLAMPGGASLDSLGLRQEIGAVWNHLGKPQEQFWRTFTIST